MKKLGKIFVLCILATFIAGSAIAVELAPNGVGDLLFFPNYAADGTGWETNFKIINTKIDQSVVAKVVVRGGEQSQELLDFFIYLSPTDVWTGKIYNDGGEVKIYSDDDSMRSGGTETNPVWADVDPVDEPLRTNPCDTTFYGYVEVFEAWNSDASDTEPYDLSNPPVDKDDIFAVFNPLQASSNFDAEQNPDAIANALTGYYEINLPLQRLSASEQAIAFRDYDVNARLELGTETFLGQLANTTIPELEVWLVKTAVYMPYDQTESNSGAHIFTFPTKKAILGEDCEIVDVISPFFDQLPSEANYCVEYGLFDINHEEERPGSDPDPIFSPVPNELKRWMCYEWNALNPAIDNYNWNWDEGYVRYSFEEETTIYDGESELFTYSGAPVIGTVLDIGPDGLSIVEATYDFGTISFP
jgi:hypothetical protein